MPHLALPTFACALALSATALAQPLEATQHAAFDDGWYIDARGRTVDFG